MADAEFVGEGIFSAGHCVVHYPHRCLSVAAGGANDCVVVIDCGSSSSKSGVWPSAFV